MHATVIYLDNNATTRVDPRVIDSMLPVLNNEFGNPSSTHQLGARAAALVETARVSLAGLIGARDTEIVFTSGGTESDNTAIRGVLTAKPSRRHVVISLTEHAAVMELADQLEREGVQITRIGVDGEGRVDPDAIAAAIRDDTALVSVMLANNETGVIQPIARIAAVARPRGVLVHTDAVQAVGKIRVNVDELSVDLLSLSGHKFHAPKGVGALYVRRGTPFRPVLIGGHQERDRRGGTQNTAGIVALGKACELLAQRDAVELERITALRDRLESEVERRFENAHVMGRRAERLPNTSCICFEGVEAEAALLLLSEAGICVSSGAACSSGSLEPSHVLRAMGVPPQVAQGEIRFSVGRFNTPEDIDALLSELPRVIEKLSALNL